MRILVLSFYFEPDLCAGSFRNTPLIKQISKLLPSGSELVVITTKPNRYKSYKVDAPSFVKSGNIKIHRIEIPVHKSGMKDQIRSFYSFYKKAKKISNNYNFDLVYASSSRLFTAFLGRKIASKIKVPLYLDVRDIFVDTMDNILTSRILRFLALPLLKYFENITFKSATHINLISEGFYSYFYTKYPGSNYSFYSNGIDDLFLGNNKSNKIQGEVFNIVYAGNIGEGQGLDKILPSAAKILGEKYQFQVYGDGGEKNRLESKIKKYGVKNITIHNPVERNELLKIYSSADFLFLHLNSFKAFEKVLPSKLFEYAAFDLPIIAGVNGYSREFINKNIENSLVFDPCDYEVFTEKLLSYKYKKVKRTEFVENFQRTTINDKMAKSILNLIEK